MDQQDITITKFGECINKYSLTECCICLELFQSNENITLFECNHFIHTDCSAYIVQRTEHCPLCRVKVDKFRLEREQKERERRKQERRERERRKQKERERRERIQRERANSAFFRAMTNTHTQSTRSRPIQSYMTCTSWGNPAQIH